MANITQCRRYEIITLRLVSIIGIQGWICTFPKYICVYNRTKFQLSYAISNSELLQLYHSYISQVVIHLRTAHRRRCFTSFIVRRPLFKRDMSLIHFRFRSFNITKPFHASVCNKLKVIFEIY